MALPAISSLQALVLTFLYDADGEVSGPDLRQLLQKEGEPRTGPAFYQCMSRLVDAGLVADRYVPLEINGQRLRKKHYRLTGEGSQALREYNAFNASIARPGLVPGLDFQGS